MQLIRYRISLFTYKTFYTFQPTVFDNIYNKIKL